ncbi:MAG: hypothetical protein COA90_04270 [Gammaproteobacteria bacterium]|nr:MAG: hypothetical protein COA90_04270 [Gammaproteobacteria bacterium]
MRPEESRELTARLEKAALLLLKHDLYRKPDDLARRFGLPVPVVRYWWRNVEDQTKKPIPDRELTPKQAKTIRRASQVLDGWEKVKRYRPECGAKLTNGRRCKHSVVIRQPEGWSLGALADRCRMHGGMSRRVRKEKKTVDSDDL